MASLELHPLIVAASRGELPDWARVQPARRPHLAAVAGLLARWARELGVDARDGVRWMAAGWLHDSLRDADPQALAADAPGFAPPLRHGPAAAARLTLSGVADEELLEAIAFHTLGRPGLRRLGRFLYLADYLEPGRPFDPIEGAALRARLPHDEPAVLRTVSARRIAWLLEAGVPLRRETVEFWNELVRGGG